MAAAHVRVSLKVATGLFSFCQIRHERGIGEEMLHILLPSPLVGLASSSEHFKVMDKYRKLWEIHMTIRTRTPPDRWLANRLHSPSPAMKFWRKGGELKPWTSNHFPCQLARKSAWSGRAARDCLARSKHEYPPNPLVNHHVP